MENRTLVHAICETARTGDLTPTLSFLDKKKARAERKKKIRASTSFGKQEVLLMDDLLTRLSRGGDVRSLLTNKAYGRLMRKFLMMRKKMEEK
jgi:hypothetical protein